MGPDHAYPRRSPPALTSISAALCLVSGIAFASPFPIGRSLLRPSAAELQPIRCDDCGARGKQPHVINGSVWTFDEKDVDGSLSARTVAFEATALKMRYTDLDPTARYAVRVTYVTERTNLRTQRLVAEGIELHGALQLPQGKPETYDYEVRGKAAQDGIIELSYELISGHNACVAEVWLLSDVPQPTLSVSLDSDLRGGLTVRGLDALLQPIVGAEVAVAMPDGQEVAASTGDDGAAQFELAEALRGQTGNVTVTARSGDLTAEAIARVDSLLFRRPVLSPIPNEVAGVRKPSLDLCGEWRFSAAPPDEFWQPGQDDTDWKPIEVPGEWVMQGHNVEPKTAAGYRCTFRAPPGWRDHVAKIRFDAVYSHCEVWLNGTRLGEHEGGFTPFEVDATDAVRPGKHNLLALAVVSESTADTLASGSSYARHPLGGITCKVTAFAVPRTHLTRFHIETDLDDQYRDAMLRILGEVDGPAVGARLRISLADPQGQSVELDRRSGRIDEDGSATIASRVVAPTLWDAEHPNLYTVTGELVVDGEVVERVSRRIGFREVKVRDGQLLVNGRPVKLHGVCRHEVHPERGRSLTPEIWRRDIELLKGANVDYVRTAHYPPAEEFIDLCDEHGIYVQDEGPWCWARGDAVSSPETLGLMMRSNAEMIERDRSHPSVIIWDLANESEWGDNYARVLDYARAEDPSRPTLFSYQPDPGPTDIITWHYPGPNGPERAADSDKPITFDEYCHLNCYNPAEVEADPGLRDYWGRALESMWDAMVESPGCLGGAIWCWADDAFDIPDTGRVGYGEWGVVDGFRRPKPEWWHVRKAYSPIRIGVDSLSPGRPAIPIENRFDHTDLREITCRWRVGRRRGALDLAVAPRTAGTLTVPVDLTAGDVVELTFASTDGRVIDEYALPVDRNSASDAVTAPGSRNRPVGRTSRSDTPGTLDTRGALLIDGSWFTLRIDRASGAMAADVDGMPVLLGGPDLILTEQETGRESIVAAPVQSVATRTDGDAVEVEVLRGDLDHPLTVTLRVDGEGATGVTYEHTYSGDEITVREIGLRWLLPRDCERLAWRRDGQWTTYPANHVGRLVGEALPFPVGPDATRPDRWEHDFDPRGCNDFRSTKYDVMEASLTDGAGRGVGVESDGSHHVRCTITDEGIALRVNDFTNGGGERFLRGHYQGDYLTVRPGDTLRGSVRMKLIRGR